MATWNFAPLRCQNHRVTQYKQNGHVPHAPGDDVSFSLGLGEVINVNRYFDLCERFGRVCTRAMALALESDLANSDRRSCEGAWV